MSSIKQKILNNGNVIPTVGLGVYETDPKKCTDLVYEALKVGYRHVDSASIYKNEQEVCDGISKWLKEDSSHKREDVFYTTKLWDADHGYEPAKKAIKLMLEKAKDIGYIDLILIHTPKTSYKKRHGAWKALEEAYEAGTVKNIGISNYGIKHVKEVLAYPDLKVVPAINQVEIHPWLGRKDLVEFCRQNKITPEAYSPLVRGQKMTDPLLLSLAKKYNKSAGQILIRWSLEEGFITLPKTETMSRLAENFDVFDFELSPEDIKTLSDLDEYYISGWDPTIYPLDDEK
ncbi:hypothetical protein OGAPHI_005386 [Ogataea philodendri]|uniref:NADP-dependent oxidoreductase domain-containing protein n=1 Tax=Ogataea philodendri TaxID=1378263 RepID=A0A9P8T335_9ASCO|nr:uncharacterized protein OGAPHI_005386 [Ogataea philodendri]KAH3663396.1 hypothetical protein OGAPHI_005386 [Ogataea philodendri]